MVCIYSLAAAVISTIFREMSSAMTEWLRIQQEDTFKLESMQ